MRRRRERYVAALALYEHIPEAFSIGWTHLLLARLSDGGERAAHVAAARAACSSIARPDLIAKHLDPLG